MDIALNLLESVAVDRVQLSGSFADVVGDCCGADLKTRSDIVNRFPLVTYLLTTTLANDVRSRMYDAKRCGMDKDSNGKWQIKVPGLIWSEPQTSSAEECCFVPFEFDKCAATAPVNLLCLKDCDDILDEFIQNRMRSGAVEGLSSERESEKTVRDRIARLSFAFYQAYNVIYGHDETFVTSGVPLKPFHGLAEIMDNAAVVAIPGGDIYSAFKSVGCRTSILGGEYVIAVNPIIMRSIESVIQPNQFGTYPAGWSMVNGQLRYMGMRFLEDRMVPVDMAEGTGEAWVLNGEAVGLYLADNLFATEEFTRRTHNVETLANGCASECVYYYNYGAAFNNNASKLMKIVDIPISGSCALGVADLTHIISPNTIVPSVG